MPFYFPKLANNSDYYSSKLKKSRLNAKKPQTVRKNVLLSTLAKIKKIVWYCTRHWQFYKEMGFHTLPMEDPDAGRDWGQEEKGTTEDEMAGWRH